MRLLLDSDSLSDLYEPAAPGHRAIARRIANLTDSDHVFISILAIFELEYGHANAPGEKKPALRQRIQDLQADFEVLPLTVEAARVFGELKAKLRIARSLKDKNTKLHNIDLMIAATSIANGCVLISADTLYPDLRDLDPRLQLENWLA